MSIKLPSYYPDSLLGSGSNTPSVSGEMSKNDILDFLNADDEVVEDTKLDKSSKNVKEEKEETEEEPDDDSNEEDSEEESEDDEEEIEEDPLTDIEDELTEPTEEQLELVTPVRRKDILKAYPDLFKKFPYLEKAYYREQQYTDVFPTPKDAKEADEKSKVLDRVQEDLNDGNIENLLNVAKVNPKSFPKLIDNYLSTLAKVDEKAYHHVIGNTIKQTIIHMVQESNSSGNEVLKAAAQVLNQFVFGSSKFEQPTKLAADEKPEVNDERTKLEREKLEFKQNRFNTANGEVMQRVNNGLKALVETNIDPKNSMSEYVKRNAVRDALENLTSSLKSDKRLSNIVDKAWERAIASNYSKESLDYVRGIFVTQAKALMQPVIQKARNEALRGMGKRVREEKTDKVDDSTPKKNPVVSQSRSSSDSRGKAKSVKDIPKGMSTLDAWDLV